MSSIQKGKIICDPLQQPENNCNAQTAETAENEVAPNSNMLENEKNNTLQTEYTVNETQHDKIEQLPAGWRRCIADDGGIYYQNDFTQSTQWERPVVPSHDTETIETKDTNLNSTELSYEWRKCTTKDGTIYYQNDATQCTQWEMPIAAAPQNTALLTDNAPRNETNIQLKLVEKQQDQLIELKDRQTEEITQLTPQSILNAKHFDFSKLIPYRLPFIDHFLMFLTTGILWWILTLCIGFNIVATPSQLDALFAACLFGTVVFIWMNPIYFRLYRYKYQAKYLKSIYVGKHIQTENVNITNPTLQIATNETNDPEMQNVENDNINLNDELFPPQMPSNWVVTARICKRMVLSGLMAPIVVTMRTEKKLSGGNKITVVLGALFMFICALKLMSHFIVFFKWKFWIYNTGFVKYIFHFSTFLV